MAVTGLLAALAANQLTSPILPQARAQPTQHQFTPLG
jgi:hypothetical protein